MTNGPNSHGNTNPPFADDDQLTVDANEYLKMAVEH